MAGPLRGALRWSVRIGTISMCGRYASHLPPAAISHLFHTAGPVPNLAPNWNVAPTQAVMVIRRHPETGERRLDALRWAGPTLHQGPAGRPQADQRPF
jgi:putative SOS response-associated peptidase YedK